MKNTFTQPTFRGNKSRILLLISAILLVFNTFAKLPPPPTPTVVLTLPTGTNCFSSLTASGCDVGNVVYWYRDVSIFYNTGATITVSSSNPVFLTAKCYDSGTATFSPASTQYKATSATYTEITPNTTQSICSGSSVTFNASSASAGLSYQWRSFGSNITGATNSSYVASTAGSYSVYASNSNCNAVSSSVNVNVTSITKPIISTSFTGTCGSQTIIFSTQTLPSGTFQWKKDGVNVGTPNSGTSSTYSSSVAGVYTVDYASISCTSTSNPYYHNQNAPLTISLIPPVSPSCISTLTTSGCSGTTNWFRWGSSYTTGNTLSISQSDSPAEYQASCSINGCTSPLSNTIKASGYTFTEIIPTVSVICAGTSLLNASSVNAGLTYQWKRNNTNISGATSSSYSAISEGQYQVVASNASSLCPFTSSSVTVIKDIIVNTSATGSCGSQTLTMTIPSNIPTGTYQWKLNGNPIAGATSSSYTTTVIGTYTLDYTYNSCTTTSLPYIFNQSGVAPTIVLTPPTSPICNSTLVASGCSGTVRWYRNTGSSYVFVTSANPFVFPTTSIIEYRATCLTNTCESPPSNTLAAIPNNYTEIIPTNPIFCTGGSVLLNASSSFSGLSYKWRLNGGDISGATNSSYSASSVGNYSLVVTNGSCNYFSQSVSVSQVSPPTISITSTQSSPATITNGQSLVLTSNGCISNGGTVLWSTSETTSTITVTPSSNMSYTFVCTKPPCTVTSSAFVVNVNPNLPPTLTSSSPSTCTGTSVTLTAAGCTGGTITWSTLPAQTGTSISVSPPITTSYTATCTIGAATSANSLPLPISVFDGVITSLASGNWNTPATWSCNCVPAACNDVIVDTGHVVTIPAIEKGRLKNLTLRGTVDVKTTGTMALK